MADWALITGASTGIGRELASVFARHGYNLVVVARDEQRLKELAVEIRATHKVEVTVMRHDLSQTDAATEIFERVRGCAISVLVNNAGFGSYGRFVDTNLASQTNMMQVNMTAVVQMTHLFLRPMIERGRGGILNVASTAAFQPGPMVNIYYATKAFVFSFTYALAEELAGTGIKVTALCPGPTLTEFQQRARLGHLGLLPMMQARAVAEAGYRGLAKGKRVVIPGAINCVAAWLSGLVPTRIACAVVRKIHKP